jgi:hypothetical protein
MPAPAGEVVDHRYIVALARKAHGRRPSQIAVAAQNQYTHPLLSQVDIAV